MTFKIKTKCSDLSPDRYQVPEVAFRKARVEQRAPNISLITF